MEAPVSAISSGVTRDESFGHVWTCSDPEDIVTVCADSGHTIPESDETNNCRDETWDCHATTTTTTTTTTTSTVPVPKRVTFKYTVKGKESDKFHCTIYSNYSGDYLPVYSRDDVKNGETVHFTSLPILPGVYRWNVNCSDGKFSALAENAPRGYWIYRIK